MEKKMFISYRSSKQLNGDKFCEFPVQLVARLGTQMS